MEMSKGKRVGETNNNIQVNSEKASSKAQRKCLLYSIFEYYQKKCLNANNGIE